MAKNNSYRRYGLANFILDVLLTIFTGGFWLIWIFCREVRR
ncbi:membrane protein [Gordonia phage Pherobrine]|nr:membrane protein [Gordonia phage Pherobrine]